MDHQTRSSLINLGPTLQQQENWAVRKSRLLSDGQTTELRIHTYPFDDEKGPFFGSDVCTVDLQKFAYDPCLVSKSIQFAKVPAVETQYANLTVLSLLS